MAASRGPKPPVYDLHPSVRYVQHVIANMSDKTGRSLEQWIYLVKREGPSEQAARRDWLKKDHKLGTNYATWIAARAEGIGWEDGDPASYLAIAPTYVEAMFAGPKEHLRPIFEALMEFGRSLGEDVKVCPCQTMVPFYREHVFAQVKPTTQKRIDLGFCLRGVAATGRLLETGGEAKGDRITHRIPITALAEFDEECERWMRKAYEMDTKE